MSEDKKPNKATAYVDAQNSSEPVNAHTHSKATDDALGFLLDTGTDSSFADDTARMRRLIKKIDLFVIPFMILAYLTNFLDKILLNYSNVMGLSTDLKLVGNEYTNAASAFWIAVLVCEVPNACTAAVRDFKQLVAVRVLSGMFESAVVPAVILISGQWYTRQEQTSRFVFVYIGTSGGFLVGGFISWGFQHISPHAELASWRVMFLALGLVTVILALTMIFLVPDTPMSARFLNSAEKIREALIDPQNYLFWLMMAIGGSGSGVVSSYSATLIKSFGYSSKRTALFNMATGPIILAGTLIGAYSITRIGYRALTVMSMSFVAMIGCALLTWAPRSWRTAQLAGVYLANVSVATTPILYAWMSVNIAGHTKRSVSSTALNAAFAVGNIIGPQTFQARDAPGYEPARLSIFLFQWCVIVCAAASWALYVFWNASRDRAQYAIAVDGADVDESEAWAGLTNWENKKFRYLF